MPRVGNFEAIHNFANNLQATQLKSRLLTVVQILMYGQLPLLAAFVWLRNGR